MIGIGYELLRSLDYFTECMKVDIYSFFNAIRKIKKKKNDKSIPFFVFPDLYRYNHLKIQKWKRDFFITHQNLELKK